jgi:hypothetical protein
MGHLTAESLREWELDQYDGLRIHLCTNFYPPLPADVVEDSIEAFKQYHNGLLTDTELAEKCHLRSVESLYRFHGPWMEG